jgi:hypothetical protein
MFMKDYVYLWKYYDNKMILIYIQTKFDHDFWFFWIDAQTDCRHCLVSELVRRSRDDLESSDNCRV